jgi:hypothetical protein
MTSRFVELATSHIDCQTLQQEQSLMKMLMQADHRLGHGFSAMAED